MIIPIGGSIYVKDDDFYSKMVWRKSKICRSYHILTISKETEEKIQHRVFIRKRHGTTRSKRWEDSKRLSILTPLTEK